MASMGREHFCDERCPDLFHRPAPDPNKYVESELAVAGALSTMDPFAQHHPAYALPFARRALEALGQWEPSDSPQPPVEPPKPGVRTMNLLEGR